jgi:hypothetical protein
LCLYCKELPCSEDTVCEGMNEFGVGRDSSVGIATQYWLDGLGIESWWGARFSTPIQTIPGAHPASYTMGIMSLFWGLSGRGVALATHPHLALRLMKE